MAIPRALLERAKSRPTPLATLGGRSAQRHHGVDGVPTPERTVGPAAISDGAPGELAQPPAIRERSLLSNTNPLKLRYASVSQTVYDTFGDLFFG
jgi:hypothetical protein